MEYEDVPAPALLRGLTLLRRLAEDGPSSLEQLADRCDLPKSSCLRLLTTLEADGCIKRDPANKRYTPLQGLAPITDRSADLGQRLDQLCQQTGCAAEAWRIIDDLPTLVDRREPEEAEVLVMARIGFRRQVDEVEAVTQVALAHGLVPPPPARSLHVWRDGQQVGLTSAELRDLLTPVRDGAVAVDCGPNSNGVRRYAIHSADTIISLAQACGPDDATPDPTLITALTGS